MGFSAEWLALREPADHAARDATLLAKAAGVVATHPVIVDLGCGTGSTRRAFGDLIGADALWRMVDADAGLLKRAGGQGFCLDLNRVAELPLDGAGLVTASALFDLVSAGWLDALLDRVIGLRLPLYAALTYDGAMGWTPALAADAAVTAGFNQHQLGDKGFGPALGPGATDHAAARLRAAGYVVTEAESAWQLGPQEGALQAELLAGIAQAAAEVGVDDAAEGWLQARTQAVAQGRCRIGHRDLLALPPGLRAGWAGSGADNA